MEIQSEQKIHQIDATGKSLGRLASEIASILRGKENPDFAAYKESGDVVVVKNSGRILLTGKKLEKNTYFSHSGYPGGERHKSVKTVFEKNPGEVLRRAVLGMLPPNRLRPRIIKRLKFE